MTPRHTTSGKRFVGPRIDPVTGESVFPLGFADRVAAYAKRQAARRVMRAYQASGMVS